MITTELRIGNLVKSSHIHEGKTKQIIKIDATDEPHVVFYSGSVVGDYVKELEGILLTPEILEAAGFENLGLYNELNELQGSCFASMYKRMDEDKERQRIIIIPYPKEESAYAFGVENIENDFRVAISKIKYFHQLQNAFYIITNTELKLTK